ncbi:MAG: hypothetical protein II999_04375 [Bacteroidaceae bacterium]|nr:hypothetical protein [Bacteroidaceae bacterium]
MQPVFRTDPKKPFEQWSNDVRTIADHQCRHWLRTEYNTAVRRAHEAAEWQRFRQEADALPCLRWMPSTSAQPGADHRQFWGTVLPVGHPFWDSHRPGDRWNCKCSLEQTDDEPTAPPAASDDKPQDRPAPGLDTRPDREAQLFSPSHPYNKDAYRGAAQAARKAVDALMREMDEQEQLTAARQTYERLKADPDYTDVKFDPKSGGVKATHVGHSFEETVGKYGIPRGEYEKITADALYKKGYVVELIKEDDRTQGVPQPDGYINGSLMDIKGIEGNPLYALNRANKQRVETAVLYFHDANVFDQEQVADKYAQLGSWLEYTRGKKIPVSIKKVICVVNKGKEGFDFIEIKKPEE